MLNQLLNQTLHQRCRRSSDGKQQECCKNFNETANCTHNIFFFMEFSPMTLFTPFVVDWILCTNKNCGPRMSDIEENLCL